jgi:hypothetical protein
MPYIRWNRDPPLRDWRRLITREQVRTPIAVWPSLKIAKSPVRHHALVTVGVPLGPVIVLARRINIQLDRMVSGKGAV